MTRRVLDAVDLHSEGSFIDVELLVQAQRRGFNIMQFGVDYFPRTRGVSTLSSWSVIGGIVRELVTLRRQLVGITPGSASGSTTGPTTGPTTTGAA